jgi:hypothetical protein
MQKQSAPDVQHTELGITKIVVILEETYETIQVTKISTGNI